MTQSRFMRRVLLVGAAVLALSMTPATTAAGSNDSPVDITSTSVGRSLADRAAARYAEAGVQTASADLVVLDYGAGGYMIGPRGATIVGPGLFITAERPRVASRAVVSPTATAAASSWEPVGDLCFTRKSYGPEHWIDACYHLKKLSNDGNGSFDYYGLRVFGTAHSPRLEQAHVESWRCCGATQSWFDWDFGSDQFTNCKADALGISVFGFGLSYGTTVCERWDITKWAAAGHFKNRWHTFDGQWWVDGDRETEFLIGIKTPQGGWPQWYIGFDVDYW